jgi:hypothetical protein
LPVPAASSRQPWLWCWQVGDYLYDAGMFVKSFAKQLETVEYSGSACV